MFETVKKTLTIEVTGLIFLLNTKKTGETLKLVLPVLMMKMMMQSTATGQHHHLSGVSQLITCHSLMPPNEPVHNGKCSGHKMCQRTFSHLKLSL